MRQSCSIQRFINILNFKPKGLLDTIYRTHQWLSGFLRLRSSVEAMLVIHSWM